MTYIAQISKMDKSKLPIIIGLGIVALILVGALIGLLVWALSGSSPWSESDKTDETGSNGEETPPTKPDIKMVKKHSGSSCNETTGSGTSACPGPNGTGCYGLTSDYSKLWVDKGCRADFNVGGSGDFHCDSQGYAYKECNVP